MATFGKTTTEGTANSVLKDNVNLIRATPSSSGTLDSISCYANFAIGRGGPNFRVKAALYTVSGNTYTLNATSNETTFDGLSALGWGWYTFDFASPPSITGGTEYGLAMWAEDGGTADTANLRYEGTGADTWGLAIKSQTYNGFPNFTQAPTTLDPCIYGTYTPGATGPPVGSLALMGVGS